MRRRSGPFALAAALACAAMPAAAAPAASLLNVSYDPTRELYREFDAAFAASWKRSTGQDLHIQTSHGGSGAQARAVLDGLQADIVTLGLARDIDILAEHGLLARDWAARLPNHAVPYTSLVVFLVRHGNPKQLRDWPDLIRPGIEIIASNPKTSSGGRWSYLAAYSWALRQPGAEAGAEAYLAKLYAHVSVLDTGARGSTNSFVKRGEGDVLLAWEDEAQLVAHDLAPGQFDIVYPSSTIRAEPVVAWVDSTTGPKGNARLAEAYLRFLYTPQGQEIAARHHERPIDPAVAARHQAEFPAVRTDDVASLGGWRAVQDRHFADGGLFDRIAAAK